VTGSQYAMSYDGKSVWIVIIWRAFNMYCHHVTGSQYVLSSCDGQLVCTVIMWRAVSMHCHHVTGIQYVLLYDGKSICIVIMWRAFSMPVIMWRAVSMYCHNVTGSQYALSSCDGQSEFNAFMWQAISSYWLHATLADSEWNINYCMLKCTWTVQEQIMRSKVRMLQCSLPILEFG
jgi:hypothetical protein